LRRSAWRSLSFTPGPSPPNTPAPTTGPKPTASSINEWDLTNRKPNNTSSPWRVSRTKRRRTCRNRLAHQTTFAATTMTYNNKIGVPEIALLRVLGGCPQGATEYHLVTRHNVAPSTIFRLVDAGLLHARTDRMAGFSWSVTWLMISGAGRIALKKAESNAA
jgi:hypothetical protein